MLAWFAPRCRRWLGLRPEAVVGAAVSCGSSLTYMFLHDGGFGHILFNMLALWMFGVELERMWGTRFFLKFYFVCGVGAGADHAGAVVRCRCRSFDALYTSLTIGASGAIFGILLAYALYFPTPADPACYFVFPVPAKYFVMIMGGIALLIVDGQPAATASRTPRTWAGWWSATCT